MVIGSVFGTRRDSRQRQGKETSMLDDSLTPGRGDENAP